MFFWWWFELENFGLIIGPWGEDCDNWDEDVDAHPMILRERRKVAILLNLPNYPEFETFKCWHAPNDEEEGGGLEEGKEDAVHQLVHDHLQSYLVFMTVMM